MSEFSGAKASWRSRLLGAANESSVTCVRSPITHWRCVSQAYFVCVPHAIPRDELPIGSLGANSSASLGGHGESVETWLILPVVICLSQRLSHACLSISFYTAKLRMAIKTVTVYLMVVYYMDNCGNSRANNCLGGLKTQWLPRLQQANLDRPAKSAFWWLDRHSDSQSFKKQR